MMIDEIMDLIIKHGKESDMAFDDEQTLTLIAWRDGYLLLGKCAVYSVESSDVGIVFQIRHPPPNVIGELAVDMPPVRRLVYFIPELLVEAYSAALPNNAGIRIIAQDSATDTDDWSPTEGLPDETQEQLKALADLLSDLDI